VEKAKLIFFPMNSCEKTILFIHQNSEYLDTQLYTLPELLQITSEEQSRHGSKLLFNISEELVLEVVKKCSQKTSSDSTCTVQTW